MVADAPLPTADDRARAYRSRLKDEVLPSVVVDCATAEVLAANARGLSALGLTPANRLPSALDSAMPAIATLRELTSHGPIDTTQKSLMFWNTGRATSWPCSISGADPAVPAHVVVVFRDDLQASGSETLAIKPAAGSRASRDTVAANGDSPPRVERDDHETLKEIARRIRDCQFANPSMTEAPAANRKEEVHEQTPRIAATAFDPLQPIGAPSPDFESSPAPIGADHSASQSNPSFSSPPPASRTSTLAPSEIAKLAHELKTPLTAIAAAAEIMRDERLGTMGNDKYLGYAADIHASAMHALAVIGNMLAVGVAEYDSNATTAFDLTELASDTVASLQPLAAQRALTLSLDAETDLTPIRANPTAVRQILLNLLTNALKFTPPGGDVRVGTGYLNDGAVFMVVRDTGDGMSDATLAQTFDDNDGRLALRPGGGRGIGLKLVRRLAAENGAEIEIDSEPGKGTVVLLAFAKDLAGSHR